MSYSPGDASNCRSCHADIVWVLTSSGKIMPVNAESAQPGDTVYKHGQHVSHFATCPDADKWRKPSGD